MRQPSRAPGSESSNVDFERWRTYARFPQSNERARRAIALHSESQHALSSYDRESRAYIGVLAEYAGRRQTSGKPTYARAAAERAEPPAPAGCKRGRRPRARETDKMEAFWIQTLVSVTLPEMGESVTEGSIVEWRKKASATSSPRAIRSSRSPPTRSTSKFRRRRRAWSIADPRARGRYRRRRRAARRDRRVEDRGRAPCRPKRAARPKRGARRPPLQPSASPRSAWRESSPTRRRGDRSALRVNSTWTWRACAASGPTGLILARRRARASRAREAPCFRRRPASAAAADTAERDADDAQGPGRRADRLHGAESHDSDRDEFPKRCRSTCSTRGAKSSTARSEPPAAAKRSRSRTSSPTRSCARRSELPFITYSFRRDESGAPRALEPGIHLGLAVDTERKDGTRFLVVPVIANAGSLDFAAFRSQIRRARRQGAREQTRRRRSARRVVHADQSGRHRHRRIGAAIDGRARRDPRRRRDRLSAGVCRRQRAVAAAARRFEGHADDEHVRPSRDSGRAIRRVSAARGRAAAGQRRVSTKRSSRRSDCRPRPSPHPASRRRAGAATAAPVRRNAARGGRRHGDRLGLPPPRTSCGALSIRSAPSRSAMRRSIRKRYGLTPALQSAIPAERAAREGPGQHAGRGACRTSRKRTARRSRTKSSTSRTRTQRVWLRDYIESGTQQGQALARAADRVPPAPHASRSVRSLRS